MLVTSLLLSVLAFLVQSPKRLIHLFSLRPPLTCPTCVSPLPALQEKWWDLHLSAPTFIWGWSKLHGTSSLHLSLLSWLKPKIKREITSRPSWIKIHWICPPPTQHCPLVWISSHRVQPYEVILTVFFTVSSSDLVWEELPVGWLCRRPQTSWETLDIWVKTLDLTFQIHFMSFAFSSVLRKQADIIGHEGVGSMTHTWRKSIYFSILRELPLFFLCIILINKSRARVVFDVFLGVLSC